MREARRLLDSFGLAIGVHKVEIIDFDLAGNCHIHHTQLPIALVGYALVSPAFARGRFPEFSFIDLIRKRPSMDETEVIALAEVCRIAVQPPFWSNPGPFSDHLWDVIDRYALWPFFERVDRHYGAGGHYAMRPRGFDWSLSDQPEIVGALAQWRKDYKGIPPARQLMVATILHLYLQNEDRVWMVRVPKKWHAVEGIEILANAGFLKDWAKLYVLYPGW